MIIAMMATVPNLLTQGRRDQEQEMVWRGQQYSRAIGLYYKKFQKYPTKIEDLTRQTNGVRFLRKAYTDPMNKEDGSWRFIYVGPNGQLIGSLRQTSLLQSTLAIPGLGIANALGGGPQGPAAPTAGANGQPGQTGVGAPGQQPQGNSAATPNPLESQPQPFTGALVGGNIIGVGSKVKRPSIRVYLGGDTYEQWEFLFNPTGQVALPAPAPAPVNPNANPTGAPGTTPNPANPNGTDGQQPPQTPPINVPGMPTPTQ
jgi:hypothetical protein